ncbi:MAG: DEAD/DEAH box helicase [Acidimicrobiales bacterium]
MNPLELAERLKADYRRFTWTTYPVADPGLRAGLDRLVDEQALLWRGPFLSVQPRFAIGESLGDLVARLDMPTEVAAAFPVAGRLFCHQVAAIERIWAGQNTLVATGTGSGKTEAFLVPVVAHAVRQRHFRGVKAIAVYPMNALVNDQEDRVRRACAATGLSYAVYTGRTSKSERERIQANPPDILLTNYSMLEFVLTRREDRRLFGDGVLRHLVLDEVHSYQGALGTEIACLVRRLRGHVGVEGLVCIGLSATVSAGGDRAAALARTEAFASSLFASDFRLGSVVEETPVPAPTPDVSLVGLPPDAPRLRAVLAGSPDVPALRALLGSPEGHPVLDLLRDALVVPRRVDELVEVLAALPARTGVETAALADEVAGLLLLGAGTHSTSGPPVLEAKVHLFLRGLPHLVRCVAPGAHLLLDGATSCPVEGCGARATRALGVCLGCGQDYDLETDGVAGDAEPDPVVRYVARHLVAEPAEDPDGDGRGRWYRSRRCTTCGAMTASAHCACGGDGVEVVVAEAEVGKRLGQCKACGYRRSAGAVEEFSARTAAAVCATAFSLHGGLAEQSEVAEHRRLLIFADSRQDTAFQAGYIKDRARQVRVRRLIHEAVSARAAGGLPTASLAGLVDDVHRAGLREGLYREAQGADARRLVLQVSEWDVLAEIASDERRPPTLERLGLVSVDYPGLEAVADTDLEQVGRRLGGVTPAAVRRFLRQLLDHARRRRGVAHELLSQPLEEGVLRRLQDEGATVARRAKVVGFSESLDDGGPSERISIGPRSAASRLAVVASGGVLSRDDAAAALRLALAVLTDHGQLEETIVGSGRARSRLLQVAPQAIEVGQPAPALVRCRACRTVEPALLRGVACTTYNCKGALAPWSGDPDDHEWRLASGREPFDIAVEEHSGQVSPDARAKIEDRFKAGDLNLLVCTQTLELGVDLGQLLAVVLRNVPPRPSNYAQRAGRAGRREERVALVVTFAGTMPHDAYHYERPVEMVQGAIRPPTFLLDNRRVVERHARALVLELCGEDLPRWMGDLVDPAGKILRADLVLDAIAVKRDRIVASVLETFRLGLESDRLPWADEAWAEEVVESWGAELDAHLGPYRARQAALLEEYDIAVAQRTAEAIRIAQGIVASLDAMRRADLHRAYVLSYLGSVGFLPSYAFPTDTAVLSLTGLADELSHDAARALRDYAPGQLVYARGSKWLVDRVDYRRAGVLSGEGTAVFEEQNLCQRCAALNDRTDSFCLSCGSGVESLDPVPSLPMRAMRAIRRERITADEEQRSRAPFEISEHLGAPGLAEAWVFERPGLVLTWERGSSLTLLNRGRRVRRTGDREPFTVCDTCGQWWERPGAAETPAQRRALETHTKWCPTGSPRSVAFSLSRPTDTLHLLADLETAGVTAVELSSYLASVRAALDLGARVVLEAGEGEVAGFDWPRPDPDDPQGQTRLAVLYEQVPGGAGYLRQLAERLGEVAAVVVPVLDRCVCESACYACLKSYANQDEHELLDRRTASSFLAPWAGTPDVAGRKLPSFSDGFQGVPRSPIERLLALALIDLGAPKGRTQYPSLMRRGGDGIERLFTTADFGWDSPKRLAVYCDGWEHHGSEAARTADREKRDALRADGWTVLSFWGGEITRDARRCAEKVLDTLGEEHVQSR